MSNFLSFFTENAISLETGCLLLLVSVFWLTCLWYLVMYLVWEMILLLFYKLNHIRIFQQESACSCVQKCRTTPIAVLLSPLCTSVHFGIYFKITHCDKNLWVACGGLGQWLGLPLFWPTPHASCTSLLCPCVLFSTAAITFPFFHLPFSACLIPDTSPKHFISTYEANPALLSTRRMGVGTLWILILPLTPKCWATCFNFHLLIASLGG